MHFIHALKSRLIGIFMKLFIWLKTLSVSNVLNIVEITANLALIFTIFYTFNNFKTEIYNENQNFAISLYKDYSVLVLDKENRQFLDTTYTNHLDSISEDYKYYVGFVLFYAESIYNLMNENESWLNTIKYMLEPHLKYISKEKLVDNAYNPNFAVFCNEMILNNKSLN